MKSFHVSLRIWHPTMTGEEIIRAVGIDADIKKSVGAPRATPKGTVLSGINTETYCAFPLLRDEPGVFTDGINELLPSVASLEPAFAQIASTGGKSELYVWVFPSGEANLGFELEPEVMRELGRLKLRLSVEIYAFPAENA